MKDNKRPITLEKDRKDSNDVSSQEKYNGKSFGISGDDDDIICTPPAVARYVNHYSYHLPEFQEPDANFDVPEGNIPTPMDRGDIAR